VSEAAKERLSRIRNLPRNDNLAHVCAKGNKESEFLVLSEMLSEGAVDLAKVVEKKERELKIGELSIIFYQVVRAMAFLEQHQMNHLRLNPSAILIKFPFSKESRENPFVQVCDLGIFLEKNYAHQFCLHKDYFFGKVNPFTKKYDECIKYDLWALGAIIYYATKRRVPFTSTPGFFSNEGVKFKEKYLNDPEKWLQRGDNNIDRAFLLSKIIERCWGLAQQPVFTKWTEVLQFYESAHKITRTEKLPTSEIFSNHIRVIFTFSKFYILIREELKYKTNPIWHSKNDEEKSQNEKTLMKLSEYLYCICVVYHKREFENYFKNQCCVLPF
jgi:serine/threonine protein kinase